ncbi:glycosyl hydrolase [Granulicella mallensis]|uniref:Uncharacterized protein n=1 Tax=Granulicella mallensis TaxID=940614 RepID=A0A7W7ZMG4_9BACT|nr:glycosyl hydrolase [Granulicella mallensis]MBB5062307.1 hypothetical protein [Granulicella mallensis]
MIPAWVQIKRISVLTSLLSVAGLINAQTSAPRPWQTLNTPTIDQVQSLWITPPPEYGPEPYYGLNGPVTLETVQRDLDTMRSLGFRAVTVQDGYGADRPYLSPEYFRFFRQFVIEAKKRNMRVWIVDDAGYPSGFAGGKFTAEHPELRMQALITSSPTQVASGGTFDQAVEPNTVAVTAIQSPSGETVQIPIENGHAHWTAPDGKWTVYIVEHAFRTSPTRSDTNPKRVKDTSQSLEDYLDPTATAQYLAYTHEGYKKAVGDEFGKTILGFRGDEPDYSINGLPWTPQFFARFQAAKGYDIRPFLAVFLQGKNVELTPRQLRARADYYDIFANLFRDGFFKPQADWCAANGLEYQVHLNHEEMQIQLAHSEGDFFRDMRYVQVPGIDAIWHQIWTDTISDYPRLASSAAHVYGHPRAFTESFAAYRPLPDITLARYILNEQFVRGVNQVETMYFPATSTPGRGGPMEFMRDPGYPALMQYTSRLSYLMSSGHPAADVALLLPAESLWMGDAKADDTFVSTERVLSEHQIDFDIVDEDAIGSLLKTEPGAFLSLSGNRYRTVLVPHAALLPATVVDRLRHFAATGGHVVFLGAAPGFIGGQNDLEAHAAHPEDFAWATLVDAELPPTPTPPAQPPTSPPAPLIVPPALLSALQKALPPSTLSLANADPALRFTHRTLKNATLFLLFNESNQPLNDQLLLRGRGTRVEVWDPQSGTIIPIKEAHSTGRNQRALPLSLAPYATEVLVLR